MKAKAGIVAWSAAVFAVAAMMGGFDDLIDAAEPIAAEYGQYIIDFMVDTGDPARLIRGD